jgi:hypothetical protein
MKYTSVVAVSGFEAERFICFFWRHAIIYLLKWLIIICFAGRQLHRHFSRFMLDFLRDVAEAYNIQAILTFLFLKDCACLFRRTVRATNFILNAPALIIRGANKRMVKDQIPRQFAMISSRAAYSDYGVLAVKSYVCGLSLWRASQNSLNTSCGKQTHRCTRHYVGISHTLLVWYVGLYEKHAGR